MMGHLFRLWRRDQRGASAVEFALILPLLLMVLMGTVTVFDVFRTAQSTEKSAFTVGDMLSRQTEISQSLLASMVTFVDKTVNHDGVARLRASSISNVAGVLVLNWSNTAGDATLDIGAIDYSIVPDMALGDSVILTELFIPHRGFVAGFGFDRIVYQSKSVHRPRFVGRIAWH